MPTNKVIYLGVIVIAASVLLWLGAELALRAQWILPYTAGFGVLLLLVGLGLELKKKKEIAAATIESTPSPDADSAPNP